MPNIAISSQQDDVATTQAKGLILMADGSVASVTRFGALRPRQLADQPAPAWRSARRSAACA